MERGRGADSCKLWPPTSASAIAVAMRLTAFRLLAGQGVASRRRGRCARGAVGLASLRPKQLLLHGAAAARLATRIVRGCC